MKLIYSNLQHPMSKFSGGHQILDRIKTEFKKFKREIKLNSQGLVDFPPES